MTYFLNILLAVGVLALLGFLIGGASVFGGVEESKDTETVSENNDENERNAPLCAFVRCAGSDAELKYTYVGESDCFSASLLAGGGKACEFSCLGLGSCAEICSCGAISVRDGVAEIDEEKCNGCGECVAVCPRGIISLIPRGAEYRVRCSNRALGSQTRKLCEVGCIGCHACEKTCNCGAIEIIDSLAYIDYSKCNGCGECAAVCPRSIITAPPEIQEEEEFDESEYFKLSVDAEVAEDTETVSQ